ncbi:thioesterase thiol ester dehydrase-isomerase [Suillus subaureus]|uniref:Thioesterase thiol ester dehydrase-isomerase n=1 Tax=Suillus subaureus TaxID=48587 RepID=A0A9P7EIM4_9AGAM|nr:thioesterase thiol ester dehydrase-isomerase [Suillus subaureus]KAG1822422.1 thioesterase thiol ester dehydrase-isomerase [Suillus subaureus]
MSASLRFTRRVWKSFIDNKGHDAQCFPNARLVIHRAVPGTVDFSLKIEQSNLNRVGTVHGGLILSLTDTLGSLAVASKGHYMTGVSTDIGASFIRPAGRPGDTLHARATLTAMGKSLAYTRVDFTNPAGDLVAYGYHTKYIGKSSSDPNNVKFSEDGEQVIEGNDVD